MQIRDYYNYSITTWNLTLTLPRVQVPPFKLRTRPRVHLRSASSPKKGKETAERQQKTQEETKKKA